MPKLALAFDVTAVDKGASRTLDRLGDKVDSTGRKLHRLGGHSSSLAGKLTALAGVGGVGALVGSSVKLAATFETTMRQVAVATDTPAEKLKDLNALALKMGADTTFSAQQAGDAMLELAKGGFSAAEIKGGALASTLTLAAAGGLDLGNAASYVVQGLRTFNLGAGKAADVAAALAGGANASTASVEDMGLALSQVGPGATQAGLSLQETTAVLAAFAQNGIKGSDAGTSLKTMLTRLIPTTDKAQAAMEAYGLSFVDAHGNIKDITQIAQQLQSRLSKLTDEQRTAALATIFGSDATRAASILMKEGAAGIERYIKATSDRTQAEKLAKAATEGTGGALEQMRGSIETAQIALGTALAPAVVDVAKKVSAFANGPLTQEIIPAIGGFVRGMRDGTGPGGQFADVVGELGDAAGQAWDASKPLLHFIGDHPKLFAEVAKDAVIFAGAMKALSVIRGIKGGVGGVVGKAASKATPIPVFVTNPGFGGPGVDLPGGKGGKGGKGKLPVPPVAARGVALGIGSVLLTSGDQGPLIGKQKEWHDFVVQMKDLIKVERGTSREAKEQARLLGKAFNNDGRQDLVAVYDLLTKYGKKTGEVKAKIAELAKDPTVARALRERAIQSSKNFDLITGGLLHLEQVARTSSSNVGTALATNVGKGVRFAMDKTDALNTKLTVLGNKNPTPHVKLDAGAAKHDAVSLLTTLNKIDGKKVSTTIDVGVLFRTNNDLPKPTGASATGGWIHGPGTGTSDSIVHRVSNGEFVVRASEAKKNAALLEAINSGQEPALASLSGGPTYGDVTIYVQKNETAMRVPQALRRDAWLKGL